MAYVPDSWLLCGLHTTRMPERGQRVGLGNPTAGLWPDGAIHKGIKRSEDRVTNEDRWLIAQLICPSNGHPGCTVHISSTISMLRTPSMVDLGLELIDLPDWLPEISQLGWGRWAFVFVSALPPREEITQDFLIRGCMRLERSPGWGNDYQPATSTPDHAEAFEDLHILNIWLITECRRDATDAPN